MNFAFSSPVSVKSLLSLADATFAFNRALFDTSLDHLTAQYQANLAAMEALQPAKGRKLDVQKSLTEYTTKTLANLTASATKVNGQVSKLYADCQASLPSEATAS